MYKSLKPCSVQKTSFIPFSSLFIFRGQVPHSLYLSFFFTLLSFTWPVRVLRIPSHPNSTPYYVMNAKSFILFVLALALFVNAAPIRRQSPFLGLVLREGLLTSELAQMAIRAPPGASADDPHGLVALFTEALAHNPPPVRPLPAPLPVTADGPSFLAPFGSARRPLAPPPPPPPPPPSNVAQGGGAKNTF